VCVLRGGTLHLYVCVGVGGGNGRKLTKSVNISQATIQRKRKIKGSVFLLLFAIRHCGGFKGNLFSIVDENKKSACKRLLVFLFFNFRVFLL